MRFCQLEHRLPMQLNLVISTGGPSSTMQGFAPPVDGCGAAGVLEFDRGAGRRARVII